MDFLVNPQIFNVRSSSESFFFTSVIQLFCNTLVRANLQRVYHVTEEFQDAVGYLQWLELSRSRDTRAVVSSIVVGGSLAQCALLQSVCDLKTARMKCAT